MNSERVRSSEKIDGAYVRLAVPVGDPEAFRYRATTDVLGLLVDNPDRTFTNRQLHRVTGRGLGGVNAAVKSLEALGVIDVDRSGRANGVQIDPEMVVKPSDPVLAIPQAQYQAPVREALDQLECRVGTDCGIVLFGSVARGVADRASDIDLFVVVERDRLQSQRAAHHIEKDLIEERFGGDRYEFHVVVETTTSGPKHDRIEEIFTEGITLRESPGLATVKRQVFEDGT